MRWRLGGPPGRADYDTAHIPGAVFVDLDTELADPPGARRAAPAAGSGRGCRPCCAAPACAPTTSVVAYDDGNGAVAARAWWLLRWAGLPADRVAGAGRRMGGLGRRGATDHRRARAARAAGDVVVRPGAMPVLDADAAAELARSGVLLDARAAPRYRGETEPVDPQAGHIPGARNLPATEITGSDGRARAPAELARRFAERGAAGATPVAAYCGSGVNAAALVLAAEHAGLRPPEDPVALYAGSWSQWSSDPSRPVATGVDP